MVENETLRTVISGTAGGIASILAVHPLDTVRTPGKTRMQVGAVFISRIVAALRPVRDWSRVASRDCTAASLAGQLVQQRSERDRENTRKRQPKDTGSREG